MKWKNLMLLFALVFTGYASIAQSGNYQKIADDYKQKIEATQDPNEKLRLALELQKIMLGESVVNGSLTPMQAASMYDKKYQVKFQASSDETITQNCVLCGPCGAHSNSKDHYDINAGFVILMHRPYGTYAAGATKQSEVEQLTAAGSYKYTSNSTACGKPEMANSNGNLDLTKNEKAMDFSFSYNTNDNTWAINLNLPYAVHTNAQNGESDDVEMFGSSLNNYQEGASITEKEGKITITANYTINDKDEERGIVKKSATTITAILTPYDDTQYDALIIPYRASTDVKDAEYESWLPCGRAKGADRMNSTVYGNALAFKIKLIEKDNPAKDLSGTMYQVHWKLESSRNAGDYTNFPVYAKDEQEDLRFDVAKAPKDAVVNSFSELKSGPQQGAACPARVLCLDNGAYGKISAQVTINTPTGPVYIDAHQEGKAEKTVSIPKDDNGNKIGDKWEVDEGIYAKNYAATWDVEEQPDNKHNGDGLTLYEEYRGIISNGAAKRLSGRNKDLIICNTSGQIGEQELNTFTTYTAKYGQGGIKLSFVKQDEINTNKMLVNCNITPFNGGEQHGVLIKDYKGTVEDALDEGGSAKALAHGGDAGKLQSPKDLDHIWIAPGFLLDKQGNIKNKALYKINVVCHEIAHACGVTHHNGDVSVKYKPLPDFGLHFNNVVIYDVDAKKVITYADLQNKGATGQMCFNTGALKESESSGDATCLMAYDAAISFSYFEDYFMGKYGIPKSLLMYKYPSDEFRNGFCRNKQNTDWNIPANNKIVFKENVGGKEVNVSEEVSMFGAPVKGGDCISQFKIKDW